VSSCTAVPLKCCSVSTHVSMSSSMPNLRSWSDTVSLLMEGEAFTCERSPRAGEEGGSVEAPRTRFDRGQGHRAN